MYTTIWSNFSLNKSYHPDTKAKATLGHIAYYKHSLYLSFHYTRNHLINFNPRPL